MSNIASDAKACFSSKVEYRAVIRYLHFKGKTGKEIHCELADDYGSSAPSYPQVKFWVGEFKPGRVAQSVGHLTRKSGVLGSIPGLATYFRFSFRFFKKGSCQLLAKVCARSTG